MKNTKLKFRIATQPNADNFMISIYAAMVMKDRQEIARRTKSALREARKRGGTAATRTGVSDRRIRFVEDP